MSKKNGKLRFAALRRVSTEKQEQKGESLAVQTKGVEQFVKDCDGRITGWYGGSEHATPGHEKKEVARLIEDAKKGRFDAVIVQRPDRWSRDNSYSRVGLETFKSYEIRFFAGPTEWDLFNPAHKLYLGMSAEIGEYIASTNNLASTRSRIEKAKKGIPTCGRLPYGRTWDEKKGWGVDETKKAIIQDCAKRYLAGESIISLAADHKMNATNLHKILTRVSGTKWKVRFDQPRWKIRETVPIEIPELLDEETIKEIHERVEKNKTYYHGHEKHRYLLVNYIFCTDCGYIVYGQTNRNGHQYYRHNHAARVRKCRGPEKKDWIRADKLEDAVMRHLFETFGNPAAVAKAIANATPNDERIQEALMRQAKLRQEVKKAQQSRQTILNLIDKGTLTEAQAQASLTKINDREQKMEAELSLLKDELANLPDKAEIKKIAKQTSKTFRRYTNARQIARIRHANNDFAGMTFEEKRQLVETVFKGKTADGRKMGVWVTWDEDGKGWKFKIEGHLIDAEGPVNGDWFVFGNPEKQGEMLSSREYALHSQGPAPPAHRSFSQGSPQCP